jgi:hypothetical protein
MRMFIEKALCIGLILFAFSCVKTPEPVVLSETIKYEGSIDGKFASSERIVEVCNVVKECMEISGDYSLPNLKGMEGGNSVLCGESIVPVCLEITDSVPVIVLPHNGSLKSFAHACAHYWLYVSTGDADAAHKSDKFVTCTGVLIDNDVSIKSGEPVEEVEEIDKVEE